MVQMFLQHWIGYITSLYAYKSAISKDAKLTVHFDGKKLRGTTKKSDKIVERLSISITGLNTEQLLEVPAISSGSGVYIANAVHKALEDWNRADQAVAVSIDTASTKGQRSM